MMLGSLIGAAQARSGPYAHRLANTSRLWMSDFANGLHPRRAGVHSASRRPFSHKARRWSRDDSPMVPWALLEGLLTRGRGHSERFTCEHTELSISL
jgi:hypothetical protein